MYLRVWYTQGVVGYISLYATLYTPGYTTTLPWSMLYYTTGTRSIAVSGNEALGSNLRLITVMEAYRSPRTLKV